MTSTLDGSASPSVISMTDRVVGAVEHAMRAVGRRVRRRVAPGRVRQPLYRAPLSDDLLFGQPTNTVMRLIHRWGSRQPVADRGASVVIVNWNTVDVLKVSVAAVRRFSDDSTEIIVVDNGSTDGSREWLRTRPYSTRVALLPANIGHGRGLDIGIAMARRPIIVTLDSDAFPYSKDWLGVLTQPIEVDGVSGSGMWGRRDRLHPACAAFRRATYYASGLSLTGHIPYVDLGEPFEFGRNAWDTAELFFESLGDNLRIFPAEPTEFEGSTMAHVVYHHYNSTTFRTGGWNKSGDELAEHASSWDLAVRHFLGGRGGRVD